MVNLADLTRFGRQLLDESDPSHAHGQFLQWSEDVAEWLDESFPDSGVSAQWSSLPSSALVIGGRYYDEPDAWNHFTRSVQARLRWLGSINTVNPRTATQVRRGPGSRVKRLFLSHASVDRRVAEYLRNRIMSTATGIDVFLASKPGQIPVGADWLATIKNELEASDAYLVLLTDTSVGRPWVQFETGAAWMSGKPLVTVMAGSLFKDDVPMPLSSFQVLSLGVEDEAREVFAALGAQLDDPEGFASRIRELSRESDADAKMKGWSGVTVGNRYFAWDGPTIHELSDRPGVPAPPELPEAVRGEQMVPSFGLRSKLAHHFGRGRLQVFETDRKGWRREVIYAADPDQVLLVHPDASAS
jgi:hypothetical protein